MQEQVGASGEAPRPRGRPRDPAADKAILHATLEMLAEEGYSALSIEAVAAKAGVGKATVYRRWHSKVALVLAAAAASVERIRVPDTGNVRDDVLELLRMILRVLTGSVAGRALPWLVAERTDDPELRGALERFWAERRTLMFTILARGIERGELPADLDREIAADLLYAPLHYRFLVTGDPLDEAFAERLVDEVLSGLRRRA